MTLFRLLFVLVLCVAAIGFYRGWFVLSSQGSNGSSKVEVQLTVDPDKAKDDARAVESKVRELGSSNAEEPAANSSEGELQSDND